MATTGTCSLKFFWEGPTTLDGKEVVVVDLHTETKKPVHIVLSPPTSEDAKQFRFRCGTSPREVQLWKMEIQPEQLHTLQIIAGIFEQWPTQQHPSTSLESRAALTRTDREIKLEIPEPAEVGGTYYLIVASSEQALKARLDKQTSAGQIVTEITVTMGKTLLGPTLIGLLDGAGPLHVEQIKQRCSIRHHLLVDPEIKTHIVDQEIEKIDEMDITELLGKAVDSYPSDTNKLNFLMSFADILGPCSFETMMRSYLQASFPGELPVEASLLIEEYSAHFRDILMNLSPSDALAMGSSEETSLVS